MTHELQNRHGASVTRHGSFVTPSLIQAPFLWITFSHHPENRMLDIEKPAIAGFDKVSSYFLVVRHPHCRCGHRRTRRLSWQSGRLAPQRMPFLRFVANRQCLCCLTRTWRETLLEPRGTDACGFQCSLPSASRPATNPGKQPRNGW